MSIVDPGWRPSNWVDAFLWILHASDDAVAFRRQSYYWLRFRK